MRIPQWIIVFALSPMLLTISIPVLTAQDATGSTNTTVDTQSETSASTNIQSDAQGTSVTTDTQANVSVEATTTDTQEKCWGLQEQDAIRNCLLQWRAEQRAAFRTHHEQMMTTFQEHKDTKREAFHSARGEHREMMLACQKELRALKDQTLGATDVATKEGLHNQAQDVMKRCREQGRSARETWQAKRETLKNEWMGTMDTMKGEWQQMKPMMKEGWMGRMQAAGGALHGMSMNENVRIRTNNTMEVNTRTGPAFHTPRRTLRRLWNR